MQVSDLTNPTVSSTTGLEIRQHNAITTARYEMTACEMDIVFYLLSLLKKEDRVGTFYRVRVLDLQHLTGRQWNYQQFLKPPRRYAPASTLSKTTSAFCRWACWLRPNTSKEKG
ncbi:replication initiation protein [Hymenobacter humi]|uniref:Replication initiation protein n=1 Tax=Hymenobacter humi TaxID=1411620 RepID=A0ABW2UFV7_9BACT